MPSKDPEARKAAAARYYARIRNTPEAIAAHRLSARESWRKIHGFQEESTEHVDKLVALAFRRIDAYHLSHNSPQ